MAQVIHEGMANLCITEGQAASAASHPECIQDLLRDLEILKQLQDFAVKIGDVHIFYKPGHKYDGMSELLGDIDKLLDPLLQFFALVEHLTRENKGYDKEWASSVANMILSQRLELNTQMHIQVAKLLDQLSEHARTRLKAGAKFVDIFDQWVGEMKKRNGAYVSER